ncbi:MAG: S53 family peptidase [Jatrophihabitans sp.]
MSEVAKLVPGSARPALVAETANATDPAVPIEVTIVLRRRGEPTAGAFEGPPLSREELAERFGADPADVESVRAAVVAAGCEVLSADPASRLVRVRGTVGVLGPMFGADLRDGGAGQPDARRRTGSLVLPASLSGAVVGVLGLDNRRQADARYRRVFPHAVGTGFTPLQLAIAYALPAGDGTGQTIAIIELGGGFGQGDLDDYFGGLGLTPPSVTAVGVDGAANAPGQDPQGADGEVLLDIEVAGAIAPGARQFVYFAPNTDAGFVDAITQAAHATPTPTAMSISWGQSEDAWTGQARTAMDAALADAALLGVTVTSAAGDSGSSDGTDAGAPHVDFPASSPHVLACGGTSLTLDADGKVTSETVWNNGTGSGATGGGVSDAFPVPDWQANAGIPVRVGGSPGRGVPDVAAVADPQTGYRVLIDGQAAVIGGTSAVAPLWAGIVCRLAQAAGAPLGLLQPKLYAAATPGASPPGFRDITVGDNGAYSAGPGWDACTGLGVPDGAALPGVISAGG